MPWSRMLGTGVVWLVCGLFAYFVWSFFNGGYHGIDTHAYWLTARHTDPYGDSPGTRGAYLYSPAFAAAIWPIAHLPWTAFVTIWMLAEAAAFVWLLIPLGWRWGIPLFGLCTVEVVVGNIYAFLAVVAVVGVRRPALWALPLLTKITPGLGPIWFAVRRDWRALAWSLGATAMIACASFLLAPHMWFEWARFLLTNQRNGQWFLPLRVAGAVLLTIFAARKNKAWLLAPAMLLANPMVFNSWMALTLLSSIPRLRRLRDPSAQPTTAGRPRPLERPSLDQVRS